ncbi:MAG: hypothetical protein QOE05_1192 [Actinomycetota bacterium]|nr:hypothetical protein [Actinomycetota bacterium]
MRIRPLATAAAAALVLGVAGPAVAVSAAPAAAKPPAGTASTGLTLLSLALAGHDVRVGSVVLSSSTVSGAPTSKVVVTPVKADGKTYGEQTVSSANSPAAVPSFDSAAVLPAALAGIVSVKSPVFNVTAGPAAAAKAGADSLGSVRVLGLPVALDGTLDAGSLVNSVNAAGNKTVAVKNLALPSIADILAALGLDLSKLPTKTLTDLVNGLDLTNTAVTTAQQALAAAQAALGTAFTTAQSAVDAARADVASKTADLASKKTAADDALVAVQSADALVTAKTTARNTAQQAFDAKISALPTSVTSTLPAGFNTIAGYNSLGSALQGTIESASPGTAAAAAQLTTAANELADAQSAAAAAAAASAAATAALNAATAALAAAQAALTAALNTLNALLGQLAPQINALLAAVTAVLDGTPLVSVDSFTVETQALVKSASAGGQTAKVVGGEIQGVHVLGTDVLNNVLGSSKVDVLDLVGSTLSQVTAKVDALNGVLSSVLSAVPGLSIPAPQVDLLTKSTSTSIANGFGNAQNSVNALSVSLPAITLPAALALPSAASLPAISGVPNLKGALGINAVGDLTSQAMTLKVGTLSEQSSFRPGSGSTTTTPPGSGPPLATTGMPAGVALLGLLLVGFGLVVRRRFATEV